MAVELGSAYLSVGASTDGFSKDVKRAFGDVDDLGRKTGKTAGSRLGKGLGAGLKVATGAVAGIAAIVGGIALKGGISRALNIEDAQAKLQGLGHDGKSIETIMDSALASVKGTAFGLGDAATVAASTVAAGIKPGEDLTRTLKLVADASTIAGTSMSDMGLIFNKVAGTGKIQGEVIAQLGERGIPILQLLADEMGVSAEEVAKLASAGKVGFTEFQNAMEAGMGGAALKSGETFRGALANVGAALGRLGEKFAKPTLDALKSVFNDAIPAIDNLTEKLAPFAEKFGKWIGGAVERASTGIPKLVEGIRGIYAILRDGDFRGSAATFGLEEDSPIVGILFTLREKFLDLVQIGKGLFDALAPTFEQLGPVLTQFLSSFSPLTLLLKVIEPVLPKIAAAMASLGQAVGGALTKAMPSLSKAVESLALGLVQVVDALLPLLPALLDLIPALLPLIPPFAELVNQILPPLVELIVALVKPIVAMLVPALGLLADYLTNIGVPALEKWWGVLGAIVGGVVTAITTYIDWLTKFWQGTVEKFNFVRDSIKTFPEDIKAIFAKAGEWLYNAGQEIVNGVLRGIESMWNSAKEKVQNFGSNIGTWFKERLGIASPSKVFAGYGKDVVDGLVLGIKAREGTAAKAAKDLAKLAGDAFARGDQAQGQRLRWLADQSKLLDNMRKALVRQNKLLDESRDKLKGLRADRAAMREQVAGGIRGELDLTQGIGASTTDAQGRQSAGKTTFASVAGVVKAMAAKAKTFAILLNRLRSAGIPAGLIQEVAGYGTEQGTAVAKALLSGSSTQIKALTSDFTALQHWSDQAGGVVSKATYDTAIAAQKGLVDGLKADTKALRKAAKSLAKNLTKEIKKALKIKSPSQVWRDEVGRMLTGGIIEGLDAGQPALDARVAGLVPRPNVPSPAGMNGNNGRNLTDGDIAALAGALARTPIVARAYLDDREARKVTQSGIQDIRRTDPAILRGSL